VIVALGETGFDYHYLTPGSEESQKKNQQAWWIMQWELACKYNLPLVIHTRDARDNTLSFMKEHDIDRCVMHCFSEDWDFARELLDFSLEIYFSFSGILTYKNAPKIQEAASKIPLNRILIETDAPFLAPQAVRGQVNEPAHTRYVLEKMVELRHESREEIERVIYENSLRFYGLAK
jgi:TatD DNase family protein